MDENSRSKAVDQLKACVDEASELGAQRVAFLSGKDPGEAKKKLVHGNCSDFIHSRLQEKMPAYVQNYG